MWQQPVEPFLHGGLSLLPLAPLCQMPGDRPLTDRTLSLSLTNTI